MFTSVPTYDKYRSLELGVANPPSEDVYALQSALNSLGFFVGKTDGYLGPRTDGGIREAQKHFVLVVDGKAGGKTQMALALAIADTIAAAERVPYEALQGQMEHESGFRLGIYSPARPKGDFDAGVTQRNTEHTPAEKGFDPEPSVLALARNTRQHYDLFSGVMTSKRRWTLAQGAWNAPAFACYLARKEGAIKVTSNQTAQPSAASLQTFEAYMTMVSKYL